MKGRAAKRGQRKEAFKVNDDRSGEVWRWQTYKIPRRKVDQRVRVSSRHARLCTPRAAQPDQQPDATLPSFAFHLLLLPAARPASPHHQMRTGYRKYFNPMPCYIRASSRILALSTFHCCYFYYFLDKKRIVR